MKVTINVECTPEEARRYMGLPDVTAFNDQLLQSMADKMTTMTPDSFLSSYQEFYDAMTSFWQGQYSHLKKR